MRIETTAIQTLQVFTHPRCPHSSALLEDYRRRGVVFDNVDIDAEPSAIERLRAVCWEHRLPVIIDHERVSIGFRGQASTFKELGVSSSS